MIILRPPLHSGWVQRELDRRVVRQISRNLINLLIADHAKQVGMVDFGVPGGRHVRPRRMVRFELFDAQRMAVVGRVTLADEIVEAEIPRLGGGDQAMAQPCLSRTKNFFNREKNTIWIVCPLTYTQWLVRDRGSPLCHRALYRAAKHGRDPSGRAPDSYPWRIRCCRRVSGHPPRTAPCKDRSWAFALPYEFTQQSKSGRIKILEFYNGMSWCEILKMSRLILCNCLFFLPRSFSKTWFFRSKISLFPGKPSVKRGALGSFGE